MKMDWNHIQILGWYDHRGRAYLIPWQESRPTIKVVVTGVKEAGMPLLDMPVPAGAVFHTIPEDRNPYEYAKEKGGLYAVACYVEEGFERKEA
ncbi:MAG: hypothetical protein ABSC19_06625 [Syntrophorhabdales bacterium]